MFGALGWGLRRYAWIVLMLVVALGVLVPVLESRAAKVYEARTLVGPVQQITLPNLDPLPRLGQSLFDDGAVADAVRRQLGLSEAVAVVPQRAELNAAQDNPIFTVIGRSSNPETAKSVADTAAAAFVIEMNKLGGDVGVPGVSPAVGNFAVTTPAQTPTRPVPGLAGGATAIAFGVAAGAVAGIGIVALLVVLRRPVLDAASAEEATAAPVMGRVAIPRGRARVDVRDVVGIASLCRRVLADSAEVVLLAGPGRAAPQRQQLAWVMATVIGRNRPTRLVTGSRAPSPAAASVSDIGLRDLVLVDGPSLEQITGRSQNSLTLLVVPEGMSARALRETADHYLDEDGHAGLVLVRKGRRKRHPEDAAAQQGAGKQQSGHHAGGSSSTLRPVESEDASELPEPGATARVR